MKEERAAKNVKADRGCKRNKVNFFAWNNRMGFLRNTAPGSFKGKVRGSVREVRNRKESK